MVRLLGFLLRRRDAAAAFVVVEECTIGVVGIESVNLATDAKICFNVGSIREYCFDDGLDEDGRDNLRR
tara:strand:+ start:293 stop:499 length:207 start_codon:yes stop_codon:yes gene_type:complete